MPTRAPRTRQLRLVGQVSISTISNSYPLYISHHSHTATTAQADFPGIICSLPDLTPLFHGKFLILPLTTTFEGEQASGKRDAWKSKCLKYVGPHLIAFLVSCRP